MLQAAARLGRTESGQLMSVGYAALEAAADLLVAQTRDAEEVAAEYDYPETVTDVVVVIGTQWIDNEGDRGGRVLMFPRGGAQPYYITQGLLHEALARVSKR